MVTRSIQCKHKKARIQTLEKSVKKTSEHFPLSVYDGAHIGTANILYKNSNTNKEWLQPQIPANSLW